VIPVPPADPPALRDPKALKASRDRPDLKVLSDHRVRKVSRDLRVDRPALRDPRVPKVKQDRAALPVKLDRKDLKAKPDRQDLKAHRGLRVKTGNGGNYTRDPKTNPASAGFVFSFD
jgi:hypothetical protein